MRQPAGCGIMMEEEEKMIWRIPQCCFWSGGHWGIIIVSIGVRTTREGKRIFILN